MQIFSAGTVIALKVSMLAGLVLVCIGILGWRRFVAPRPARWEFVDQPIPFSHKHHVGEDGIDCRYCHTSVESRAFAGIPPMSTCMTCHSQLFTDAPVLALLRDSFARGSGLAWRQVHHLPDFVYFDHSIHIAKGVGCSTCHGRVDRMPLMQRVASLQMQWCVDCHRRPEQYLRPRSEIFDMAWQPGTDQERLGRRLRTQYGIHSADVLTACSTCHR
ncbi:MAG: cytochrome c3 family protein [Steroidobacteraceae bacterium]